jgi:DNA repair protein SbcD/Mre11
MECNFSLDFWNIYVSLRRKNMKFIHTSDWHIGRLFHNISLLEDQEYVLEQIISYAKNESVDAIVIAGDIYDRSVPPASAVEVLDRVLKTICTDLNIPILLIPGNHDSAERLRFGSSLMKSSGLYIFGDLANVTIPVNIKGVDFYGIPYADPDTVKSQFQEQLNTHNEAHKFLISKIQESLKPNAMNVLISHCFIDGGESSESERPLSIGGAECVNYEIFSGFDYVALGHLHSPQYRGRETVRYSGSIMKYSFSEITQKKGITLVEIDGKNVTHTLLPLVPKRDLSLLEGELDDLLKEGKKSKNENYLLIRLTDQKAILDPMGKLREVFPNVLHIEKSILQDSGKLIQNTAKLKRSEFDMFRDFYEQVSKKTLTEDQNKIMMDTISELQTKRGD